MAVGLGVWAESSPWLAVTVVTLIAVLATWCCNAFNLQPGAYQIALSCAAGTLLHTAGARPLETAALVLVGGLLAGAVSAAGAIADPRGPERESVVPAAEAVARFFDGLDVVESARLRGEDARRAPAPGLDRPAHAWVTWPTNSRGVHCTPRSCSGCRRSPGTCSCCCRTGCCGTARIPMPPSRPAGSAGPRADVGCTPAVRLCSLCPSDDRRRRACSATPSGPHPARYW